MTRAAIVILALAVGGRAYAQDDLEKKRLDLLGGIKASLEEARKSVIRGVDKIFTDEIARGKPTTPPSTTPSSDAVKAEIKKLEERLKQLKQEERSIQARMMELRWADRDAGVREELRKTGLTPQEAQELFQDAMDAHNDKDFKVSIPAFKKIYYQFGGNANEQLRSFASIAAYNVSCAYSLDAKAEEALDWLEISLAKGFMRINDSCHDSALDHINADTDLDNIRKSDRFKEILRKFSSQ